jgi:hypothetical protein
MRSGECARTTCASHSNENCTGLAQTVGQL